MVRVEERWLGYERQSAHTGMIVRLCMGMCVSNTAGVNNEHSFKSSLRAPPPAAGEGAGFLATLRPGDPPRLPGPVRQLRIRPGE